MIKILSVYNIPNRNTIKRIDEYSFDTFINACIEEKLNPTTVKEKESIIEALIMNCVVQTTEDVMSYATFAFVTCSPLILNCVFQKYINEKTFGIYMIFDESRKSYQIYTMSIKKWQTLKS